MATPHASGIAGLLLAMNSALHNDDIENILKISAEKVRPDQYTYDSNGWNIQMGYGRVNAQRALNFLQAPYVVSQKTDNNGTVYSISGTFQMTFYSTPGLADGVYIVKKYVVRKTTTFPATFSSIPYVWRRGVASTGLSEENPNWGMGWCRTVDGTVTTTGATLETIVYEVWNTGGQYVGFIPTIPANAVMAYTVLGQIPPAAPMNLVATAVSPTQINLSWLDNSTNETGFKIERKKSTDANFVQIATVGASVTSYNNTGLQSSTTYNYRVRAYNQVGDSPYSNTATATTQSVPPITSVTITGPDPATPGVKNFYTANVTGGSGNFNFQWYKRDSASGANYYWYDGGNGVNMTDVTPGPTTFALRVDVTDNVSGQLVQAWKGVGGASVPTKPVLATLPKDFMLGPNFPNPFNPETTIKYALPQAVYVRLEIYNIAGQRVRTLLDGEHPAGYHTVRWDGRSDQGQLVASGLYMYRLTAGTFTDRKKMLLLK